MQRFYKRHRVWFARGGWVLLGLVVGFVGAFEATQYKGVALRGGVVRLSGYSLISPLLACDVGQEQVFTELDPLKSHVKSTISNLVGEGKARDVSVYLRTLNGARWFEINGEKKFTPASLLKVIIMLGYLQDAQTNPGLLDRSYVFNIPHSSETTDRLVSGNAYTVNQLLYEMIAHSSNDALHLLLAHKDVSSFDGIYHDLNIAVPSATSAAGDEQHIDYMDPVSYSMIFRVLYGATYLNREMSEKALDVLSHEDDTGGLASGVPAGVTVAHKFGLYRGPDPKGNDEVELHDCGVIYYPEHPYLLCVMTRGANDSDLHDVISTISQQVYQGIDALAKKSKQ